MAKGAFAGPLFIIIFITMETPSRILDLFQSYLNGLDIPTEPAGLYTPARYALSLGGKRMRPLLMLMAYNIYRDDLERCMDAACGMEIFHNYTLLHDDVMDNADMRRGKPTVHVKWNVNTAILSGDAMAFLAYRYLLRVDAGCVNKVLSIADRTFIEVSEGQQFDMDFESRNDVREEEYMEMIRLKTSVLPAAALKIGAVVAGASDRDADALYAFGEKMGLAFQLQDDLLDVYGDPKVFGKKIGGDILCNKKTYLYIKARSMADAAQNRELDRWAEYDGPDMQAKIAAVTAVYDSLDIRDCCRRKINDLYSEAMHQLEGMDVERGRLENLIGYAGGLINRQL